MADPNQIAYEVVQKATQQKPSPKKNQAAVELGRLGGLKGGPARAKTITARRRKEIASMAANARWLLKGNT